MIDMIDNTTKAGVFGHLFKNLGNSLPKYVKKLASNVLTLPIRAKERGEKVCRATVSKYL